MDEPFGALDAITREHERLPARYLARTGKTVVFVTHSIDEAVTCPTASRHGHQSGAHRAEAGYRPAAAKNEATFSSPMFHRKSFQLRLLEQGMRRGAENEHEHDLKNPRAPASRRLRQAWRAALPSLALVLLIVALWEAAVRLLQVSARGAGAVGHRRRAVRRQDELFQASLVTGAEILYGFLCSCVVGSRWRCWWTDTPGSAAPAIRSSCVPERAEDRAGAAADPVVRL